MRAAAGAPVPIPTALLAREGTLAGDARAGLTATPKTLPSQYLYDALGSALFEAICRLPWYEVTRAEQRLLARQADAIAEAANPSLIVELGPGSGEKLATLVRPVARRHPELQLHLIDISPAALEQASRTLGQLPRVRVTTSRATYDEGLKELAGLRAVAPASHIVALGPASAAVDSSSAPVRGKDGRAMVAFLGSNLGNFDPPRASQLLARVHDALAPGDTFLLGTDLVKREPALLAAYDDPLGVTAAFNRNLLVRMNRELGADFDLDRFEHRVRWDAVTSRVEMHLVSRGAQTVRVPGASVTIDFRDQESIWTESSYKYDPGDADRLGRAAGFRMREQWVDASGGFALTLFDV